MPINASKSQKTSGSLGNFYINNRQINEGRIGVGTLYSISRDLQRLDRGLTQLKKQSQYNETSFCLLVRSQDLKEQCWSPRKLTVLLWRPIKW